MESIRDYFCFHCQADCFDLVDITAFMDVGYTLLYSETPPSPVIGNRVICIHISNGVISVGLLLFFFHQELNLGISLAH